MIKKILVTTLVIAAFGFSSATASIDLKRDKRIPAEKTKPAFINATLDNLLAKKGQGKGNQVKRQDEMKKGVGTGKGQGLEHQEQTREKKQEMEQDRDRDRDRDRDKDKDKDSDSEKEKSKKKKKMKSKKGKSSD